jgi:hypothetical protein
MLNIWYSKDYLIPNVRSSPLLSITSSNSDSKQLDWNSCKKPLKDFVNVNYFNEINKAGRIIVIPHTLEAYKTIGNLQSILKFHQKVLATAVRLLSLPEELSINPNQVKLSSLLQPMNLERKNQFLHRMGCLT